MDGWMKRYHESLKDMSAPIEVCEIRQKLDTRGLLAYAKKQGKKIIDLSDDEKMLFMK